MTNATNWDQFKPNLTLKYRIKETVNRIRYFNSNKIFCIGFNKTGTTSLKTAINELDFSIGSEYHAKFLFNNWVNREWNPIINYCKSAEFFQDSPFSLPYTFIPLDKAFPNSKFILTVRDNEEQWYNSLIRFHGKLWGNGNVPPSAEDLKNAKSKVYKGRPYHTILNIFDVDEREPYNKDVLIDSYLNHINNVKDYFRHRPNDLLIINVSIKEDYLKLCEFLNKEPVSDNFQWKNKT